MISTATAVASVYVLYQFFTPVRYHLSR